MNLHQPDIEIQHGHSPSCACGFLCEPRGLRYDEREEDPPEDDDEADGKTKGVASELQDENEGEGEDEEEGDDEEENDPAARGALGRTQGIAVSCHDGSNRSMKKQSPFRFHLNLPEVGPGSNEEGAAAINEKLFLQEEELPDDSEDD